MKNSVGLEKNKINISQCTFLSVIIPIILGITMVMYGEGLEHKLLYPIYNLYLAISIFIIYYYVAFYISRKELSFNFNTFAIVLAAFVIYVVINSCFSPVNQYIKNKYLPYIIGFTLYIAINQAVISSFQRKYFFKIFVSLIACIIIIQFVISLLQFLGLIKFANAYFRFGGTFLNPAQLANFAVICLILFVGYLLFLNTKSKYTIFLLVTAIISCLLIVIFANGRTAWIATLVSVGILLFVKYKISSYITKYLQTWLKRFLAGIILGSISIISIVFLYNYKTVSADGRLFNWKICVEIIRDKPLFGFGVGTYNIKKAEYQINYFINNPQDEKNRLIADTGAFACNDFLEMATQIGLFGMLLFIALLLYILYRQRINDTINVIVTAAILGFYMICLFSYPLSDVNLLLFLFILFALISYKPNKIISISFNSKSKFALSLMFLLLISIFAWRQTKEYVALRRWEKILSSVLSGSYNKTDIYHQYKFVYPYLDKIPEFHYDFGLFLYNDLKDYSNSLESFQKSLVRVQDPSIYNLIAMIYERNGDIMRAEENYINSAYLVPYLFVPKYELLVFYDAHKEFAKAILVAEEILKMPTKIYNQKEGQIRMYAANYLKNKKI